MSHELITVARFDTANEAGVARLHLESAGIPAVLDNAEVVAMAWYLGNAVGYVQLNVPEEHASQASAILEQFSPTLKTPERVVQPDSVCLVCGHTMHPDDPRCSECGWSFADEEQDVESDDSHADSPMSMANLRSWKRPVLVLWLAPILITLAIGAIGVFVTVFEELRGEVAAMLIVLVLFAVPCWAAWALVRHVNRRVTDGR